MEKGRRNKMVILRLNEVEREIFREKAKHYKNVSAMIRDAVMQFNDVTTKGKIDAMDALSKEFENISTEFSRRETTLINWRSVQMNSCMLVS